jgi:hypothetical protein
VLYGSYNDNGQVKAAFYSITLTAEESWGITGKRSFKNKDCHAEFVMDE